jgi:hypothetical protein
MSVANSTALRAADVACDDQAAPTHLAIRNINAETPFCLDHHLRGNRVPDRIDDSSNANGYRFRAFAVGSQMAHPILGVFNYEKA